MKQVRLSKVCITSKETINPLLYPETKFHHYSIPAFDNLQLPELMAGEEIQSNKLVLNEPCILFSRLNPRIKRVWDLTGEKLQPNSVGSTEWVPFIVNDARVLHPRYLFWFLHSDYFVTIARGNVRAATKSRERVNKDDLFGINIPLPPLAEQKRIARILDVAAAVQAQRRATLTHLDTLLQSTFLHLFGDPVTNPMRWKRISLQKVCERIIDCPHSTPKWQEEGVVCLRTSNLSVGGWNWSDTRYVSEEDYVARTQRSEIIAGDIILSREGTVGIAAIVEPEMRLCMGQRLVQLRPNRKLMTSEFLLRFLLYELDPARIEFIMSGSTSKHLNVKDLRNMEVAVPPLSLQEQFTTFFNRLKKEEQAMTGHNQYLDTLFQSLQQRAFRGELSPSLQ